MSRYWCCTMIIHLVNAHHVNHCCVVCHRWPADGFWGQFLCQFDQSQIMGTPIPGLNEQGVELNPGVKWHSNDFLSIIKPILCLPWYTYLFLVGGAAQGDKPLGRKGGTPTLCWRYCPRHGARPFRERYAPPHLPLWALCGPSGISFGV